MRALVTTLLLVVSLVAQAQVHIKNQHYIQLNVGGYDQAYPTKDYFFVQAEYGKYNKKLNSNGFAFLYGRKLSSNLIPVEKFQLSLKQEINLFSSADLTSTFKVLGTVNFGYESINREKEYHNDDFISTKSAFILGLGSGVEYEFSPLVIGTRITYNFLSNYQKFSMYPYLGFKFHLK